MLGPVRVLERVREVLAPEGPALDLAVLRITLALVLASSASVAVADDWAALPAATRVWPLGVAWFAPILPISPGIVGAVRAALWVACGLGAVGLFARTSLAVATVCAGYVMLIPQLGGAVFHDHHLLWLGALLAASPCGDALSIDAWRARRRGAPRPSRGRAHGAAVRVAWILIGLVFLFPGIHKLAESGVAWIASDNLRNQMWWKWAQDPAIQPAWRIDRHPMLLRVLAFLTVAFELSFLPLVFWRRTRALAVGGALAFHAATDLFMGIGFSVLWTTYTMFVPWEALAGRTSISKGARSERGVAPIAMVGGLLVLGASWFGAIGAMHAYPFACYPTFQWIPDDRMPAMAIEIERADGTRALLDPAVYREPGPRGWALEWSLVGVYGSVDRGRVEAWWHDRRDREPLRSAIRGARSIHVYRTAISVDPDQRGRELSRRELLTL